MKFLFLVTGLGEAAQGTAVALYAREKGTNIRFVSTTPLCHDYIAGFGFEDILYSSELPMAELRHHVDSTIEEYSPDAIFCCNSKTTDKMFLPTKNPNCPIVSLDSNWLFQDMPPFFDRFFVVFPREIFERNRNYGINDARVQPVGFIPSGYEFSLEDLDSVRHQLAPAGEKLIFAYFGRGVTFRDFLLEPLLEATRQLAKQGRHVQTTLVSDREASGPNVTSIKWLASDKEFDRYLAASSCLVSHHGMGTMAKAIMANVPVISFVPEMDRSAKHSEAFEVEPFEELGLCVTLPYSAKPEQLKNALEDILFGPKGRQIREEQAKYRLEGEPVVFEEVTRLVRHRRGEEPG
jgi:predicted glycosyltransferase